jgi:hypothetical protein
MELMGRDKGYNSSHTYCQVKGCSKKSYETFSNDFEKGFENGMMEGEKMDSRKKILKLKFFFSSQNINFPILSVETLGVFSFFPSSFFQYFLSLSLSLSLQCSVSLRTWGF